MIPVIPANTMPLVDNRGMVTTVWQRFFNALTAQAGKIVTITPAVSPLVFTAPESGFLAVSGGTVSAITINRGTTTISAGITSGSVPMANGDIVTVTYSATPEIAFVPS